LTNLIDFRTNLKFAILITNNEPHFNGHYQL